MLDIDACQSFVAAPSGETNANNGDVLVVAAQQSDSDLVCRLLLEAGYRPQRCQDSASLNSMLNDEQRLGRVVATVLCHQSALNDEPSGSALINRPGHLPEPLHGMRLIAVSDRVDEDTVVSLLLEGAHHCFDLYESPRILKERLEAALRRHSRHAKRQLTQGDIRFDLEKRRVTRAGRLVDLSPKEFELAYYLFSNRGRVVENSELMTSIWSLPSSMDTRRIDTAACRVRKKLQLAESSGWQLKRLRCVGYRLVNSDIG